MPGHPALFVCLLRLGRFPSRPAKGCCAGRQGSPGIRKPHSPQGRGYFRKPQARGLGSSPCPDNPREGQLLSIIQPSGQTGQSIALTSNITNQSPSTLPIKIASSKNVATIPGLLPARAKVWSIGGDGTPTIRGDVEKRIDLIYANKFYTKIIEDFGNPDEIIEGRIYAYRNMRVHYFSDGSFRTQVHFHFINGKVTRTEALP